MSSTLIVGKDCSIAKVHKIIRSSTCFHLLYGKWTELARDLEIPEVNIKSINRNIILSKISLSDAINEILHLWVGKAGEKAFLEKLLQSLEGNGLTDCAQRLTKELRFYSETTKKYVCIPSALENLLNSNDLPSGLIILRTLDITITMEKIRENLLNCDTFSNYEALLDFGSAQNEWTILVVTDNDPNTLANLLGSMSGNKPFNKDGKLVFLIDEEEENIKAVRTKCGFSQDNAKIITDEMEWNDLNFNSKHEVRKRIECYVGFRLPIELMETSLSGQLLVDLINNRKDLHLIKSTLPDCSSYYIQRFLLTRNIISEDVFQSSDQETDVFVFQGISRSELSNLTDKLTANSSEQLQNVTTKFIVLDQLSHFTKICLLTNNPVHLIKKKADGKWKWIKSKGAMQNIHKNISKRETQKRIAEDALLAKMIKITCEKNSPVCISDKPGMGKSVLLAQIGRKLQENFPERIVAFVVLPELVKEIRRTSTNMNEVKVVVKSSLTKLVGENRLGEVFLESKLNSEDNNIWIELLLDGFDEVDHSDRFLSHDILNEIKSFKSVRLWVTTRPHLLKELESTLNVLGYNMQPFCEENQIHFLTRFWSERFEMPEEKFTHFASTCLEVLKKNMNSSDEDIAGIPLQCLMIAEIFQGEAKDNSGSSNAATSTEAFTFVDLYELLIEKKIQLYSEKHAATARLTPDEIIYIHKWLSLQLLFSDYAKGVLPSSISEQSNYYEEEILKVGLLEATSTVVDPRFIHRTLAEYLTAKYVVETLAASSSASETFKYFLYAQLLENEPSKFEEYLAQIGYYESCTISRFLYPTICHFLNFLIPRVYNVGLPKSKYLFRFSTTKEIILACVTHSFANIFKLFCNFAATIKFERFIFNENLICTSIRFSNLELIKIVFTHFEKYYQFTEETRETAFRRAVQRMDFSIIEFLLKDKKCKEMLKKDESAEELRILLRSCANETNHLSKSSIETRIEIIREFLNLNKDTIHKYATGLLFETTRVHGGYRTFKNNIHIQIIIQLITLGADLLAKDTKSDETILHITPWLNEVDYEKLIKHIGAERIRQLAFVKDRHGSTPLNILLERKEGSFATLKLFNEAGTDFNSCDVLRYSVLAAATRQRNRETLHNLVTFRADVNWKGENGQSLLHLAVKHGNSDAVTYYLNELKFDVNILDSNWMTPLDYSIMDFNSKHNAEIGKVLSESGGLSNIGHLCARLNLKLYSSELGAVIRKLLEHVTNNEVDYLRNTLTKKSDIELKNLLVETWLEVVGRNSFLTWVHRMNECSASVVDIISYLLKKEANVFERDEEKRNFLHLLLKPGQVSITALIFRDICDFIIAHSLTELLNMKDYFMGLNPLHLAARAFDLEERTLQLLRNANVSFDQVDNTGNNLLVYAIEGKRNFENLANLVKFGVKWKCQNFMGRNLLHHSAVKNNILGLKYFLKLGLSLNDVDENGWSPLMLYLNSSIGIELELVKFLCDSGANINLKGNDNKTALDNLIRGWDSANFGKYKVEILKYLIDKGADIHSMDEKNPTFIYKWISSKGHNYVSPTNFTDLVKYLIQKELCSVLEVGEFDNNCTPLHIAMYEKKLHCPALALLHSAQVNFNLADNNESSLLMYAISGKQSLNVIDKLIEFGADTTHLDKNGCSLLHTAAQNGNAESLEFIIKRATVDAEEVECEEEGFGQYKTGPDVNRQDNDGNTPLHCTMLAENIKGLEEKVSVLLEAGADVSIKNGKGHYPFAVLIQRDSLYKDDVKNRIRISIKNTSQVFPRWKFKQEVDQKLPESVKIELGRLMLKYSKSEEFSSWLSEKINVKE